MGFIVGLVLLVVTGAVVAGAVIWRKKHSGREGREESEFSCLTGEFQAQVEACLRFYWAVPLRNIACLSGDWHLPFCKAHVEMKDRFLHLHNSSWGPDYQHLKVREGRSLLRTDPPGRQKLIQSPHISFLRVADPIMGFGQQFWKVLCGPGLGRRSSRISQLGLLPGLSRDGFFLQVKKEGATLRLQVSVEGV